MIYTLRLLLLLFVLSAAKSACAQEEWQLKRNENGIEVYTRKLADEKFKEIKVVAAVPGPASRLVAAILDIESYPDWVYGIRKAHVLQKPNPNSVIYYSEADLPWPLTDRDLVNHITVQKDAKTGKTTIHSKALRDYMPEKEDFVRVPFAEASWDITPAANNALQVVYRFRVDPGGSLPAWAVNSIATVGPYNTFMELREKLQQQE